MSYIVLPFGVDFSRAHAFYQDNIELLKNQYGDQWLAIAKNKVLNSNEDEHDLYNEMVIKYGSAITLELVPATNPHPYIKRPEWMVDDGFDGQYAAWNVLFVQAIDGNFVEHQFTNYQYDDWVA